MSFKNSEVELIFGLAEKLTGSCQNGNYRKDVLLSNFERLLIKRKLSLAEVFKKIEQEPNCDLKTDVISALTIHTTAWFREAPHFDRLKEYILSQKSVENLNILCAASSTGEEAYSIALLLESLKAQKPSFNYNIEAFDIDPISISKAERGTYLLDELKNIDKMYHHNFLYGSTRNTKNYFAISKEIRSKIRFSVHSLNDLSYFKSKKFDIIFCRNVLIYFDPLSVNQIVSNLNQLLKPTGYICLGHSETCDYQNMGLNNIGHSCYFPVSAPFNPILKFDNLSKPRVLVIDDSKTFRVFLERSLENIGATCMMAENLSEAKTLLSKNSFSLISLDLNLPDGNGYEWLKAMRKSGLRTPIVVISEAKLDNVHELLGALESNAQDYIPKEHFVKSPKDYCLTMLAIAKHKFSETTPQRSQISVPIVKTNLQAVDLVLLVSSTGGPQALSTLLQELPKPSPPIVIVQHITAMFAEPFAKRLANIAGLKLLNPANHPLLQENSIALAHDARHIQVFQESGSLKIRYCNEAPRNGHSPSGDVLYESASHLKNVNIFAAILTGMGADGAQGLLTLKSSLKERIYSISEAESSCIVYGMPKEAKAKGAIDIELELTDIKSHLHFFCGHKDRFKKSA